MALQVDIKNSSGTKTVASLTEIGSVKLGTKNKVVDDNIVVEVVSGGGVDPSDATATAADILASKTAYIADGSKATGTILSKSAATITPTTSNLTIASGQYLSGAQTILGDANLVAANIAKDVTIFGVTGTHAGGGLDPSDATATAADIAVGKTAYIATGKTTGTMPKVIAATTLPTSELGDNGDVWFLIS